MEQVVERILDESSQTYDRADGPDASETQLGQMGARSGKNSKNRAKQDRHCSVANPEARNLQEVGQGNETDPATFSEVLSNLWDTKPKIEMGELQIDQMTKNEGAGSKESCWP